MFETAPGIKLPFPEGIPQQYEVQEGRSIRLNISFEKLGALVQNVYELLAPPLFFVLELPLNLREEQALGAKAGRHREVLYLDGQSLDQIHGIMERFGKLLLADGMSQFAIASHRSREEIYVQKYKLTDLYSPSPRRFVPLLKSYGLTETDRLFTPWDSFSPEHPGECTRICMEGLDVYQAAEILKKQGMYRARIVEE